LVMDDDEAVLEAVGEMMTGLGFSVYRAINGKEALTVYEHCIQSGLKFQVFLLDSHVPGGTVCARASGTPLIFI